MSNFGTLILMPKRANLSHDTELLLKMDPYILFYLGRNRQKTQTCKGGGKTPIWNDKIKFHRTTEDSLFIEIWDEHQLSKNRLVAVGEFPIHKVISKGFFTDPIMLYYKQNPAGFLHMDISWEPDKDPNEIKPLEVSDYEIIQKEDITAEASLDRTHATIDPVTNKTTELLENLSALVNQADVLSGNDTTNINNQTVYQNPLPSFEEGHSNPEKTIPSLR